MERKDKITLYYRYNNELLRYLQVSESPHRDKIIHGILEINDLFNEIVRMQEQYLTWLECRESGLQKQVVRLESRIFDIEEILASRGNVTINVTTESDHSDVGS